MFRSYWTIIREHVGPSQSYHWPLIFTLHFGAASVVEVVTLARIDVLPDDGPVGPKHVGVLFLMFQ
jgi:hypothetical protein